MVKKKGLLFKWMAGIFAGLALIAIAGYFILSSIIHKRVVHQLRSLEPELHIAYSSLHTDFLRSTLSFDSLSVQFNPLDGSAHYHQFKTTHLLITGIHYLKAASAKDLPLHTIRFDSSEVTLDQWLLDHPDSSNTNKAKKMPFEKVFAKQLRIPAIHISLFSQEHEQLQLEGNIMIDDAVAGDRFSCRNIRAAFNNFFYHLPGAHHTLRIKNIMLDSQDSLVKLHSITVTPAYSKYEFGKKIGRQADHISASVASITVHQTDLLQLIHRKFIADKISVSGCKARIFRDRRLPRRLRKQALPMEFLESIPIDIHVKHCVVSNASVLYEEFPAQGDESGILRLENVNTAISPLINHRGKNDPDHLNMQVSGSIMGSGTVEGTVVMPFGAQKNYRVDGIIKNLELTSLNSSAENLGLFHIKSGLLDILAFHFTMNEKKAEGKIVGEYHQLVIQKLELNKKGEKNVAHARSFVLRRVIIPLNKDKSLPEKKRTGKVDYTRDPTRFVANYLLQSLLTGIKSSFTFGFLIPK